MLRKLDQPSGDQIAPRAIFARPIEYFSSNPKDLEDGAGQFRGAFFREGNGLYFELRAYVSHPEGTATLYLQLTLADHEIFPSIQKVTKIFELPWSAVLWHFGEDVNFLRPLIEDKSRLREQEARLLALKIASESKDFTANMQDIREGVQKLYPLSPADRRPSPTRPAEQLWQQILRNVVSHRGSAKSIFAMGFAHKVGTGIQITKAGLDHLKKSGFES